MNGGGKVRFDTETGQAILDAKFLANFAYKKPIKANRSSSDSGFVRFSSNEISGELMGEYVTLEESYTFNGTDFYLSGTADKLYRDNGTFVCELEKRVKTLPFSFISSYNTSFLAEGVVVAYTAALKYGLDKITLMLTFAKRDGDGVASFCRVYSTDMLSRMTDVLISRSIPFVRISSERKAGREQLKKLAFPYGDIRSGQHELMLGVMKTVRRGGKLVASAPTGTGKTMATLYPSLKALGAGYTDRIFYLTGKSVTGKAALDAVKLLSEQVSSLRCIVINSKQTSCTGESEGSECYKCPKLLDSMTEDKFTSYAERRNEALGEILTENRIYTPKLIAATAEKYGICTYELSLDVSEFCEVIICDYNYVFDKKVMFRRYFMDDRGEKYTFLIDESHNLPDRVRASYSGDFSPHVIERIMSTCPPDLTLPQNILTAIEVCEKSFTEIKALCLENVSFFTDKKGEHTTGYFKSEGVPESVVTAASRLAESCKEFTVTDCEERDFCVELSMYASQFLTSAAASTDGFSFLAEMYDDRLTCRNICIDPSSLISDGCDLASSAVMFSATLDPIDYFSDMLGAANAPVIKAESPFDSENMSVTVFDGVSTRFSDRASTAYDIAEIIATVLDAKEGHYFVFFPSYKYMRTVAKALLEVAPHVKAVMQKQDMTRTDRDKFLAAFKSAKFKNIVGLCVLGGVFSEGVDLIGDSLIGTVIVGAGLPGLSSELNLMSEYFENKYGSGHLYAYDYPAINRIEQAAGRVIRSADDRGVVVLVDDRLSSPEIARRFPDYWPKISCTSDVRTLSMILERFWEEK